MAHLEGHSSGVQFVGVGSPMSIGGPQAPPAPMMGGDNVVIDGTPVRVLVLAISAALGLGALKAAGFRFNVAVST